jgi:hypothetical protein
MPTREEIVRKFSASPVTVNSALTELREGGFVEVRGKTGTFVSGCLPHQTRYAVAFGLRKEDSAGSGYFESLARECSRVRKTEIDDRELEIVPFYDLDRGWDSPDYVRLMNDIRSHRIAGIIGSNSLSAVIESEEVVSNRVPVVVNVGVLGKETCSTVSFDASEAAKAALDHIESLGSRKPGFIFSVVGPNVLSEDWLNEAARRGMDVPPFRIQMAHLLSPGAARHSAHVMMMLPRELRPDALVIADDNLVPYAIEGLKDAGVTDADNFPIVAHANFPWPTECALPALRVGYDVRQMIRTCVAIIDRMRANGGAVEHKTIAPVSIWQTDLDSSSNANDSNEPK